MTNKERLQQNNLELEECIALVGTGGGGSVGGGVIDVTELPEVGVEGAFYRLTTKGEAEVYIVENGTTVTAAEYMSNLMHTTAKTKNYVVKTLPETLAGVAVVDGFPTFSLYIIEETGIVYCSQYGGSAESALVGSEMFRVEDRGWVDNIDDVDKANAGVYCASGEPTIDLFSYSNGEWVKYIYQNAYDEMVANYETEIDERDIRLAPVNFEEYVILDDAGTTITGVSDKTLKSVEIPSNITALGFEAFATCEELKFVIFEENSVLATISDSAFVFCAALKSIVIPDGVTSIGKSAFAGCSNLTSITIPTSVTSIGDQAFIQCSNLESIIFAGTKAQWKAITKGQVWDYSTPDYIITCTDGTIAKDGTET